MKIKDCVGEKLSLVLVVFIFVIFLPLFFGYLLFILLSTPFDYVRYKRSRYQKDFPHKYTWLREPHLDHEAYTAINGNGLPVDYIRLYEDYDMPGRFIYKDTLLWFYPSIFFDKDKKQWLWWPGDASAEEESESDERNESDKSDEDIMDDDNTDDCLSVEALKEFLLDELNNGVPTHQCRRVVFFYKRKKVERQYGKEALEIMRGLDDFIVYEKGELETAIKEFIDHMENAQYPALSKEG